MLFLMVINNQAKPHISAKTTHSDTPSFITSSGLLSFANESSPARNSSSVTRQCLSVVASPLLVTN